MYNIHYIHYIQYILYIVQCIWYTVQCTVYMYLRITFILSVLHKRIHWTLCNVHCAIYTVHCTLYTVHCTMYNEHPNTSYSLQCTYRYNVQIRMVHAMYYMVQNTEYGIRRIYIVQCTVYTVLYTLQYYVHCTVYTVYWNKLFIHKAINLLYSHTRYRSDYTLDLKP